MTLHHLRGALPHFHHFCLKIRTLTVLKIFVGCDVGHHLVLRHEVVVLAVLLVPPIIIIIIINK